MTPPQNYSTASESYTARLQRTSGIRQYVDVQKPYRWNLRRLQLGTTLDVGCGVGRNLAHLGPTSVGVDHNPHSIAVCRDRGLTAYTSDEFEGRFSAARPRFDSLLAAHLLEHLTYNESVDILRRYLPHVRPYGSIVIICPQEAGYKTDATHVEFVDFPRIERICQAAGLVLRHRYSFPFPRPAGIVFPYNEFCAIATNETAATHRSS